MTFDLSKPYTTRDGREAKVLGTVPDGQFLGWVKSPYEGYCMMEWNPDGRRVHAKELPSDLINIPEKRTVKVWINVFDATSGLFTHTHRTRIEAEGHGRACEESGLHLIAIAEREITFEVGEGLESTS